MIKLNEIICETLNLHWKRLKQKGSLVQINNDDNSTSAI